MAKFEFQWPIGDQRAIRQVFTVYDRGLKDMSAVWDSNIESESVAEVIRRRGKATFEHGESPQGEKWPALSPRYARRKGLSGGTKKVKGAVASVFRPILVLTGELKRAITKKNAPGQFIQATPRSMTFTVLRISGWFNVGRIHQQGGKHHPRRSWMGLRAPIDFVYIKAKIDAYCKRLKGQATAVGAWRSK